MPLAAVTGGARGIGRAIAAALAERGYRVAIGDINGHAAETAAAEIGCLGLEVDVASRESTDHFVSTIERELGPIEVFVNNAGMMTVGPFLEQDDAVIRRQLDVNVLGVVNGMRAVLPGMQSRRRGVIVNIASAAAKVGVPGESTYSATKHAVLGLSEAVRAELHGSGVEISVVMPAVVDTELARGTRTSRGVPRLRSEHVAAAVVRAIEKPRFEVYVPRSIRFPITLAAILPQRWRDGLGRITGLHRVAGNADSAQRSRYEAEITAQARETAQ